MRKSTVPTGYYLFSFLSLSPPLIDDALRLSPPAACR